MGTRAAMIFTLAWMGIMSGPGPTMAAAPDWVMLNLSDECAKCVAFYSVMKICMGADLEKTNPGAIDSYINMGSRAQYMFGHEGGKSDAALLAATELALKSFMKKIENNCVNIDVIMNEVGDSCHKLLSDPLSALREALAKP